MNAGVPLELPSHTWSALVAYLHESGSSADPEEVIGLAIEEWIAQQRRRAAPEDRAGGAGTARNDPGNAPGDDPGDDPDSEPGDSAGDDDPGRGYQWKTLFLPAGTRLRMWYDGKFHYADVVGDDIRFGARKVSPAQFANAVAGNTRNAWRDIWLLFPRDTRWKLASLRRRQAQQLEERLALAPPPQAGTPAPGSHALPVHKSESESESDDASKYLRRLANLIEQALIVRQMPRHRRRTDSLGDDVAY
jgi:hypothetical protein